MRKLISLIVITFCIAASGLVAGNQSRLPPKVEAVFFENLKLTAPNTPDKIGMVVAYDVESDKIVWEIRVYMPDLEDMLNLDFQFVWIKKIEIVNEIFLRVEDEEGNVYQYPLKLL